MAFEIGSAYLRGEPLERLGGSIVARLCAATGTTPIWACCTGAQMLYLAKEQHGKARLTLVTEVGVRLPAT